MSRNAVEIVEVAPRDGFQSIAEPLPTGEKVAAVEALMGAGLRRVEIGSFVSPRAIPQMADMDDVAAALSRHAGVRQSALVPNVRGAERALAAGLRELVYVFSVSEAHNRNNVRQGVAESIEGLRAVVEAIGRVPGCRLRVDLATAFDCPFEGAVAEGAVLRAVASVAAIAPDAEIALCDTTGRANPVEVRRRFRAAMAEADAGWAFHGHDTFGLGVANALFAFEAGVGAFDGSAAGLGGCPFAPGATGNTATEDLVFAFEEAGIDTGVDLASLLDAADRVAALPGGVTGGHLRHVPRARAVPQQAVR